MVHPTEPAQLIQPERALEQLQLIANKMAATVTRCTRDFRYAWVNERYAEWLRRPVGKIIGDKIQDVVGTEAFLRLQPYFERVLSGETVAYEEKITFSCIGERWISGIYTPTFDSQQKVDGWVAVVRDITTEKATESAVLDKDKRLADEANALAKLNQCSLRLWQTSRMKDGLSEMLRATIELLGANKGNVQMLDPDRSVLTIAAQQGFQQDFLDYFREVSAQDDTACGRALRKYMQVVIEDIEKDAGYAAYREVARAAGYRAVISSPLIGRDGKVLGLLSTHFGVAHRPTKQELGRLELYTRQAADFIERCKREEELQRSEERYRKLAQTLDDEVHARTCELDHRNAEVVRQAKEVRALSRRLLETQDHERRNVARELHDSAGQTLAFLAMTVSQLQDACKNSPEAMKLATQTEESIRQLDREIRTASYLLHPPLLDETGLASAISMYLEGLRARSGLEIALAVSDHFHRLPAELELVLFRVVQECLTNIHKHSASKSASVRLGKEQQHVVVEIRDEGKGISLERLAEIQSAGLGLGIRGMRERVQQFNGTVVIGSDASGTRVLVNVPIPKVAISESFEPLRAARSQTVP